MSLVTIDGLLAYLWTMPTTLEQAQVSRSSIKRTCYDVSPKAGVNYQVNDDLMADASYTRGLRSGDFKDRDASSPWGTAVCRGEGRT